MEGKQLLSINAHDKPVTCVAISNEDKLIISGSQDKTIKIWDRKSGN